MSEYVRVRSKLLEKCCSILTVKATNDLKIGRLKEYKEALDVIDDIIKTLYRSQT